MDKTTVSFTIETKEAGQRRRYGDSFYHYIVESEQSLQTIEAYCKKVLKPSIPHEQYKKEQNESFDNNFRNYYTEYKVLNEVGFLEDGFNKVSYKVVSPSTH
jgi:hypothetical protein